MEKELSAEEFRKVLDEFLEKENEWISEENPKLGQFRIEVGDVVLQPNFGKDGVLILSRGEEDGSIASLHNMRANLNSLKKEWDRRVGSFRMDEDDLQFEYDKYFRSIFNGMEEKQEQILGKQSAEEITLCSHDPQKALECLLPAVCNRFREEDFLKHVPHRDLHDLAVYYRVTPAMQEENTLLNSFAVTDDMLKQWNRITFTPVTEEKLFDAAYDNALKVHKTTSFRQMVARMMSESMGVELVPVDSQEEDSFIVSNVLEEYGAAGSFLGIGLEKISEESAANLYLIPSSVDEALIYADNGQHDTEKIARLVSKTNTNCVSDDMYLSDNVYYYDRDTKRITVVYDGYEKTLTADAPENRRNAMKEAVLSTEDATSALEPASKPQFVHRRR